MPANERILITGGAGFIGSHLADALLARGYRVRVLDGLSRQVHADAPGFPDYLDPHVEAVRGDIRSRHDLEAALAGVDAVFHFAAAVGVARSMYEIERYTDVNNRGTAVLLETLLRRPVRKLVVASSMSIYGEGLYRARTGRLVSPRPRSPQQLRSGRWEVLGEDGEPLEPVPTPETKIAMPESIYALSKYGQERMCLLFGQAHGVPVVALRFFNVYGERQALSNPYTGVLAIFAARYLNGRAPVIFEDGRQQRDFVHVRDVAKGCVLALECEAARNDVFNLGSGSPCTILEAAERLGRILGRAHVQPEISGRYRTGDVRHCFADISRARSVLGYTPEVPLDEGLAALSAWLEEQTSEALTETADRELRRWGLVA